MASHLLKWVHFQQDAEGRDLELRYFRDTDGREVDFVVVERRTADGSSSSASGRTPTSTAACGTSGSVSRRPTPGRSRDRH